MDRMISRALSVFISIRMELIILIKVLVLYLILTTLCHELQGFLVNCGGLVGQLITAAGRLM